MNTDPVTVTRLVPDLDDELCHALDQVEELLLTLAMWDESEQDEPNALPAPVAQRVALGALNRIQNVLAVTQTRRGWPARAGRLLGPDGRYEHRPLRLVQLDPHDLQVLAAAAAALGRELAVNPCGELAEAMAAGAEAAAGPFGAAPHPVELVEALARALGVLDLASTEDSIRLAARVAAAGDTDLVLDDADEAAYQRTADRLNAMWAGRSVRNRFLY